MCGIVAMFSRTAPVLAETIQRATKTLHHRGRTASATGSHPRRVSPLATPASASLTSPPAINPLPMKMRLFTLS